MSSASVLYIASTSYSGSTLLDILIGRQTGCLSLGEFHRLGMPVVERIRSFGNRCSCGARLHDCEYWENIRKGVGRTVGVPEYTDWNEWRITPIESYCPNGSAKIRRALLAMNLHFPKMLSLSWNAGIFREWKMTADYSWMLYRAVASVTGQDKLIDSSKSATRLWSLHKCGSPSQLKVIHLVRDGRGVAHSFMSRNNMGIKNGARFWARKEKAVRMVVSNLPVGSVHRVHYEDLCAKPKEIMRSICNFLGTEFDENKVVFPDGPLHMIPGNPMSLRPGRVIRLNDRWRKELGQGELRDFEHVAGRLNAMYGYNS